MTRNLLILLVLVVAGAAAAWWWLGQRGPEADELLIYGNVDLRQVQLAFNNSERIAEVLVQEGDVVNKGQVLARLDVSRLEPQVAQAQATAAAQRQVYERLRNGLRPEEIAQARANVAAAQADVNNARLQYERDKALMPAKAVSQAEVDTAKATLGVAEGKLVVSQKALDLAVLGPRREEIDEAEARWHAAEAQLAFLKRQREDAQLLAPVDAVVRTRLLEPGEMATPMRPVYSLAIVDPKWVRAYVSEPDLGKVRPGMKAMVVVDSFPNRPLEGWVGFISPVAEFTPKAVQTQELRTSLVYEVRVFVNDLENQLRLGMPATVHLSLAGETRP